MKDNKTPKKDTLHSTWVRIVLLVLVFLMVASMATFTGIFIFNQIKEKVAEKDKEQTENSESSGDKEDDHDHTEEGEKYY